MYKIFRLPQKNRIVVEFDKYQDHDREQFQSDLQRAALSVRSAQQHFDMLADFTDSMVMPQPIAKDSQSLTEWLIENGMRRSANITQSVTQRMQISRVTDRNERFGYFATRREGEQWLDS